MTARTTATNPAAGTVAHRDARELATLVRTGTISASSVVREHLDLIARRNPDLNAFVHVADDGAEERARAIDEQVARGLDPGPLAGVPFSVKDVISVAGMPLTAGSRALRESAGTEDAPAVARMKAAGAVCVGKTNTPEFALWTLTWNEAFGSTLSPLPLDPPASPGGSSGGEAAAVASGMSAVGLGSDFGGSVRWPAHCTGLVSLRPTPGTIPSAGQLPGERVDGQWRLDPGSLQARLQVVGPLARSVADLRIVLDVVRDSGAHPTVLPDGTTMGWCAGEGNYPVDRAIVTAVGRAAERLSASSGTPIPLLSLDPLREAVDLFGQLRATDQQTSLRRHLGETAPGPVIADLLARTRPVDPAVLDALWARQGDLTEQMTAEMPDVLLLPVASIGAPPVDAREFDVEGRPLGSWDILACCQAISLFGLPAGVVPIGSFPDGRPIGAQVVARPGQDDLVLSVMQQLENALGRWRTR